MFVLLVSHTLWSEVSVMSGWQSHACNCSVFCMFFHSWSPQNVMHSSSSISLAAAKQINSEQYWYDFSPCSTYYSQWPLVPQCSVAISRPPSFISRSIHYGLLNLVVVDTCLFQSFSAAGVSDLMTGELSVVIVVGKWSKKVVDIIIQNARLHVV